MTKAKPPSRSAIKGPASRPPRPASTAPAAPPPVEELPPKPVALPELEPAPEVATEPAPEIVEAPEPTLAQAPEPDPVPAPEFAPEPVLEETPTPVAPEPPASLAAEAPAPEPVETPAPQGAEAPIPPRTRPTFFFSETTMSTFDFTAPFQTAFADLQEKTKAAFEKSTSAFGDYNDFAKGNVEAFVEAGKIFASGLQELTTTLVSDSRTGFETLTSEVKELASAKTPTDFLKLQNDLVKKHFDETVAAASKHSEALVKLANEATKPISTRVSLAVEKVKTAA